MGILFLTDFHRWTEAFQRTGRARKCWLTATDSTEFIADVGSNALCSLYAEGLLWARNVRQKTPWTLCALWEKKYLTWENEMSSVREKTSQQVSSVPFLIEGAFYFSQIYTDEQNTQSFTETLSQPISQNVTANRSLTPSPSPIGEGSDHRGYPSFATCVEMGISTLPSAFCSVPS